MHKFPMIIVAVLGLLTTAMWFQSDVNIANIPIETYETVINNMYDSPTLEAKYYYAFTLTSAMLNEKALNSRDRLTVLREAYRYSKRIDAVAPAYKDNKRLLTILTAAKKYAGI